MDKKPERIEYYDPNPPAHIIRHAEEKHRKEMEMMDRRMSRERLARDAAVAIVSGGVGILIGYLTMLFY